MTQSRRKVGDQVNDGASSAAESASFSLLLDEPAVRLGSRSLCCRLGDPFVGFGGDCIGLERGDFGVTEFAQLLQNDAERFRQCRDLPR